MNNFIENIMAIIIIGDEESKQFDGKIKMNGRNDGFFYHCDSIKQIIKELTKEGYSLDNIDFSNAHESGFDLVNMGHILFLNCTMGDNTYGYLFLPTRITKKQIESLRLFESNLQKFQKLFIMKINELNKQSFETEMSCYDFNVEQLENNYYKKTK